MSAIAVVLNLDGRPASAATLERMLAAVPHRARDGCGRMVRGPIAMGHGALHTTPQARIESQPHCDESGELWLTLDGRVDNREQLARELTAAGAAPRADTDAELVLRACQVWGDDAPRRIIGDFAFALWDARRRRLLCARDPLGVKCLYYHAGARLLACASEPRQLLADPRVPRKPNEGMIGEIATQMPASREETLFAHILRLPPRHALVAGDDGVSIRRYYEPNLLHEIRHRTDEEYAAHFRELFEEAVRCRLRASATVASDLSGGVDSSSVVATAVGLLRAGRARARLETFSVLSPHPRADERIFVREIERALEIRTHELAPAELDRDAVVAQVLGSRDLPDFPNAALGDYDAALVGLGDTRVLLTGIGGDEWLNGSAYAYADDLRRLDLASVVRRLRARAGARGGALSAAALGELLMRGVWPLLPDAARGALRRLLRRGARHLFPLAPEFARRIDLEARVRAEEVPPDFSSLAQRDVYRSFASGAITYSIEMTERWAALRGLEARHPLCDRRIVEFALAVPEEQRARGGLTKFVLRGAMRGRLPDRVRLRRTKGDYSDCYVAALESMGGARNFERMETVRMGWFDAAALRDGYESMLRAYRAGRPGAFERVYALWMALAIEMWFNSVFMNRDGACAMSA
jgi:asparagine synthase (glutamine-hydrolysing)